MNVFALIPLIYLAGIPVAAFLHGFIGCGYCGRVCAREVFAWPVYTPEALGRFVRKKLEKKAQ